MVLLDKSTRYPSRIEPILNSIVFSIVIVAVTPLWSTQPFNTDEGINLMKAALLAKGYSLFSEIWTDQPPVLTFILAGAELLFPRNIIVSRGIILIFSGLLLWSLFRIVYRTRGASLRLAKFGRLGCDRRVSGSERLGDDRLARSGPRGRCHGSNDCGSGRPEEVSLLDSWYSLCRVPADQDVYEHTISCAWCSRSSLIYLQAN